MVYFVRWNMMPEAPIKKHKPNTDAVPTSCTSKANKERIALFHLPSYSQERNPGEYLNRDLKSKLGRKATAMNQKHMQKNLIRSMRRFSKSPQHVASYFDHQAVAYAKAA